MERTILWKTIIMDSVPLTGATTYQLFAEADEDSPSIGTYTEDEAIR